MRNRLCLLLCALPVWVHAQDKLSTQLSVVKQMVEASHVQPRPFDDHLSSSMFDRFIHALDPAADYFTVADLKPFEKYRYDLDDQLVKGNAVFFNEAAALYRQKLKAASDIISSVCDKPFDFNAPDFLEHRLDTMRMATDKQLREKWYLLLKADVLAVLQGMAANQLATKNVINKTEILAREPEVRAKMKARYLNKVNELMNGTAASAMLSGEYINAYLGCMDPHSEFLDAAGVQTFQSAINTEGYYFGFTLGNTQKGEVEVTRLQPGGAAWLSGMIHEDDVLLQLKWQSKEAVNLAGMEAAEVSALLDQSNTEKLDLTVRKKSGEVRTVTLQKRKLENEENIVKSFVLKGQEKVGYITLPSFYTTWEDASGSSCASDVAREVIKLKKDSIKGLVLDLRYNGGGSLQEAVEMAGIFIDEGAVCQLNSRGAAKPAVLRDMNRGVIYTGPLIVLVNGYSASASELLAGTLQDYNRALVVGSRTFGKATGQDIKPLNIRDDPSSKAFVKLTGLKLYRVTGRSIQQSGVRPDVTIPDPFENFIERESDNPFSIPQDTIGRYKYFTPMKELSKAGLQAGSAARVKVEKFSEMMRYAALMDADLKKERRSLRWDAAENELRAMRDVEKAKLMKPSSSFVADNNKMDAQRLEADALMREINKRWLERIAADPFIEETYMIMLDFIKLN